MKRFLGIAGVLGVVLGLGLKAEAGDIYVPSQYTTIQQVINVANSGDTIQVAAGTYAERIFLGEVKP